MTKKKLYLIGIDAAPLWLINELKDEQGMDGFRQLLEAGSIMNLESTMPPMTGPAWPSIYTGLEPSKHGVPDFFEMKSDYTPELVFYDSKAFPPFWEALAKKGVKCLVITPATQIDLPEDPNYDLITGFPLPAKTNSQYLEKLMKKYEFEGEPDIEKDIKAGTMSVEDAAKRFVESAGKRIAITRDALANKDYDFVYVCFTETDRLQHFVTGKPNRKDYLAPLYAKISSLLSDFISMAKKEKAAVVVVSDHGTQPIKRKLLLNSWMIKKGYVVLKESVAKSLDAGSGDKQSVKYEIREKLLKSGLRRVYDKMPHGIKSATAKVVGTALSGARSGDYTRMHLFDYNMQKSVAFAAISNDPVSTIWINDSRFKSGIVAEKDRTAVKSKLMKELAEITDEKGAKVMEAVYDADSYYKGSTRFIAADILVEAKPGYTIDIFYHSTNSNFMEPEDAKSGDHIRNGIFGSYPKDLHNPKRKMAVTDISPLILKYFGI